jgi:hypothetical protein
MATSAPTINRAQFTTPDAIPIPSTLTGFNGSDVRGQLLSAIPTQCPETICDPRRRNQTTVAGNFRNPYTEQWSFGVEREIGTHIAAEARYVGNHTLALFQNVNGNPALNPLIDNGFAKFIPAGLSPCSDPTQPGFSRGYADCNHRNLQARSNVGSSHYNGLQTRLDIRNWHHLSANFSYTFSKNIDTSSEIFSTGAGGQGFAGSQNPFDNTRGERGLSGVDYPHVFTMSFVYELPWYNGQQGLVGHVLGGWQLNTVYRYTSGQPWTPLEGFQGTFCDPTGTMSSGTDSCRPILANAHAPLDSVGFCTDPTVPGCGLTNFSTGAAATFNDVHWVFNDATAATFLGTPFGGVSRNTLRGQSINNASLSIYKDTKVTEKLKVQFQASAFNVFNRQYRGVPDPYIDDASSGSSVGSFANNFFNNSGGFQTNATESGIGRRRLIFGLKLIF